MGLSSSVNENNITLVHDDLKLLDDGGEIPKS